MRVIQRILRDKNIWKEPKTFAGFAIPPKFQSAAINQKFLLYDNNGHRQGSSIFESEEQLDFLNSGDSWHFNGTYAVSILNNFLHVGNAKIICRNVFNPWLCAYKKITIGLFIIIK